MTLEAATRPVDDAPHPAAIAPYDRALDTERESALDTWIERLTDIGEKATWAQRVGIALAAALLATLSAFVLDAAGATVGMLAIPVLIIVVATSIAGMRAGLLATLLTIALVELLVFQPRYHLSFDTQDFLGLIGFAVAAVVGGALSQAMRQSRARAMRFAEQRQQLLRVVLDSDRQIRGLADAMPILVARAASDGSLDYFNRALLEYTGMTQDELNGDGWASIVHPDDMAEALERWQHRLQTGVGEVFEQRLRRHDGMYRWHLVFGEPVHDADGRPQYWIGANVDIHDRKVAEEALARSQERYRTLADSMDAMVCSSSHADGMLDFFNRRFYEYTGLDPDSLPERPMSMVIHPDEYGDALRLWEDARIACQPFTAEHRFRRADGEYRWHMSRGTPLPASNDGPQPWMLTIVDIHDRKVAEEALEVSEQRWRSIAEGIDLAVAEADSGGWMKYYSPRWREYVGMTLEELLEAPMSEVHPDDIERVRAEWQHATEVGEPLRTEWRARRADGEYRWHLAFTSPLRSSSGEITSWVGGMLDIHERKLMEESLQSSEERYRLLADSMEAIVCVSSRDDGVLDFFNQRFYEYTGLSHEDVPAPPTLRHVLHPDDFPVAVKQWYDARGSNTPYMSEYRWRRHDGVYRWHMGRANPMPAPAGGPTPWIFAVVDVDDQKRAEDALRDSETRYRTLVDAAPVFVYNAEPDGTVTFASESFYEYTGLKPQGRKVTDAIAIVIHPDDLRQVIETWKRARESGDTVQTEARILGADGVYRWFLSRVVAARDSDGNPTGWVGTSTNIEDRKHAEEVLQATAESLQAANSAKDEFLGLVSHELKTPITTILGNAEVLHRRGTLLDDDARASALADIQHDAARLHQIIENLLILARLERGREIEMEPLLVPRLVDKLVSDHRLRFPHRDVRLSQLDPHTPVMASEVYLEQVIRNLLSNAEKYSPPHMPIDVHLHVVDQDFFIEVLDRGVGVPPGERPYIFDAFYRSQGAEHVAGVGIGLAVCKRLVEAEGGTIEYAAREDGGSCFRVCLPVYQEDLVEA